MKRKDLFKKLNLIICLALTLPFLLNCSGGSSASNNYDSESLLDSSNTDSSQDVDSNSVVDSDSNKDSDSNISDSDSDSENVILFCDAVEIDGRLNHGDALPLAQIDPYCGKLSYGFYSNQDETNSVNVLPDFSFAGYMKGGVAIPDVSVARTLNPLSGDNLAAIQTAIDEVSLLTPDSNGFRGAVLLTAGTYNVSDTINISASGVVLKGEGQGESGTVLVATKAAQHNLIELDGIGSGLGEVSDTRVLITSSYVAVGSKSFDVADASNFNVGDIIGIARTPNQTWIDELEMGQWGWTPEYYEIDHERTIEAILGNTITIDIPIVDTIADVYGGGSVFLADMSGRIEQCGVEDIRMVSEYTTDTDENHGWNAIYISRTINSWVRRVTVVHFGYSAVTFATESSFNTVEEVAQLDPISLIEGGRRYSFYIAGGIGNLFNRCFAREGRHNFVTGSRVTGPHVWLDSLAIQNNSDEGPHHRWSVGLLFDNIYSDIFNAQNRVDSGSGHGWAGAQTLFWNIYANSQIVSDAPKGAMNWVVGGEGTKSDSGFTPEAPDGIWDSLSTKVTPRSLYLSQLEDRLGTQAVANVTIPQQLSGDIWNLLNGWAGEGNLVDATPVAPFQCSGILSGSVCCPLACGQCGGAGCGSAPGGSAHCCSSTVLAQDLSCIDNPPPCVMP